MAKYNGEWDADPRIEDGIGTIETSLGSFSVGWERYIETDAIWQGGKKFSYSSVNVQALNEKECKKCLRMYLWDDLSLKISDSGEYWLNVGLDDGHYGSPEYKIQNVKIGDWSHLKVMK